MIDHIDSSPKFTIMSNNEIWNKIKLEKKTKIVKNNNNNLILKSRFSQDKNNIKIK